MAVAVYPAMAFITMWRRGIRQCLMVLDGEQISIRLVDGRSVLQDVLVKSPETALRLAAIWEIEEKRAAWRGTAAA
jgi:hypothetical protein